MAFLLFSSVLVESEETTFLQELFNFLATSTTLFNVEDSETKVLDFAIAEMVDAHDNIQIPHSSSEFKCRFAMSEPLVLVEAAFVYLGRNSTFFLKENSIEEVYRLFSVYAAVQPPAVQPPAVLPAMQPLLCTACPQSKDFRLRSSLKAHILSCHSNEPNNWTLCEKGQCAEVVRMTDMERHCSIFHARPRPRHHRHR